LKFYADLEKHNWINSFVMKRNKTNIFSSCCPSETKVLSIPAYE
jgi:hypothetical protein